MKPEEFLDAVYKRNEEKDGHPDPYKDAFIYTPPCDAQFALDVLFKHFLGEDYCVTFPFSNAQCNTQLTYAILEKYPHKKSLIDFIKNFCYNIFRKMREG